VRRVGVSKKTWCSQRVCLAGITFFWNGCFYFSSVFHDTRRISWGKKSGEVFMHGIDLGHGLYVSHKDLGRESFHKRTCNFVQGGLHVTLSCAYMEAIYHV
jgi:hypothetical protein